MSERWKALVPWTLTTVVGALAVYVWGQSFRWEFSALNAYLFFPVLGLLAYSILWSQYMVNALSGTLLKGAPLADYFRYTGYAVLAAIVLHPSILIYSLFRDGFGLPPGSYTHFVRPGMEWIALLGTASLFTFLAFELRRWYGDRLWWKYVVTAGDVAMIAIFYHGLRLGNQLQSGWFVAVWWFYGLTLLVALARKYIPLIRRASGAERITNE